MQNPSLAKERSAAQRSTMLRGTAWLTLTNILSRLLGAIYIIPWFAWMGTNGNQANALFSMGYNIYALFLLISTAGLPVAIAREVAHYNALGQESLANRLVRQILVFMVGFGLVAAAVMYFFAPGLAALSGGGENLIPVMQSLALAVLIFPAMSIVRGYFQGLNDMRTVAISQLYEQIIRVIWMLVLTFMIMKIGFSGGRWETAVTQSTFAAFIGMIASCVVLVRFLIKEKLLRALLRASGKGKDGIRPGRLLLQTLYQAAPFVIIGSAIQIFKIIDQITFVNVMRWMTSYSKDDLQVLFAYFSANTDKLTMIMIGTAAAFGDVALPMITKHHTQGNQAQVGQLISYDLQLFAAFMVPAVLGMVVLAEPFYVLFYGTVNELQLMLFIWALFQSLLLGLYTTAAPILQALRYSRKALVYFAVGLVIKLVLQVPAIMLFQSYGPLIATTLAFLVFGWLTIRKIYRITRFKIRPLVRGLLGIGFMTVLMLVVVVLVDLVLGKILHGLDAGRVRAFIEILIAGGIGFGVYLVLSAKVGLLEKLLGARGTSLRRRLHI